MAAVNLTTPYEAGRSGILATVLICFMVLTAGFNILFLYVFFTLKKTLRRPPNYFLACLAFVDALGAVLWVLPAVVAAARWEWVLGAELCSLHSYMQMWCFCMNMHLFVTIMFEKFCKILFPSKHKDAFYSKTVVCVVIAALCVFDAVIAALPLIGWGQVAFFTYQYQCVPDFEKSASHMNFALCVTYAIPVLIVIALCVAIAVKIKSLKQKVGPSTNERFVLQEKKDVVKESFAEKLKKQQASFQMAGMKKKKPKVGGKRKKDKKKKKDRQAGDDGYETESEGASSESSHFESTDDETEIIKDYDDYKRMKREKVLARKRKRIYTFKRSDMSLAITVAICFAVYAALWCPYWVISYTWVYTPESTAEAAYVFFTLVTYAGGCFKPAVYVGNKQLRAAYAEALKCNTKRKKAVPPPTRQQTAAHGVENDRLASKEHVNYSSTLGHSSSLASVRAGPELVNLYHKDDSHFQF